MSEASISNREESVITDAWSLPLEACDPAREELFEQNAHWSYFERLRKEAPVQYFPAGREGPYWSIARYADIKAVDTNHEVFSSERSIVLRDAEEDFELNSFITMDPPKHNKQRASVQAVVAPSNLAKMESTIRSRVATVLDGLPVGEPFDWVSQVSIELTTQMLATLFDFPFEERSKLTRWSDVTTGSPESGVVETEEQRRAELLECLTRFTELWNERVNKPGGHDLISMLAHSESTRDLHERPMEFLGNLVLLIVGGNDTTRNSMSGGVIGLNQFPDEYQKLRDNPGLIPNMVSEIIRWQTPLAYMRRTATQDTDLAGQKIREGDKLAMWYVSGNRDADVFANANDLVIDRPNARQHLSFGFGLHRCMGNRLGELQLRILWEEILKRFHTVEVVEEPVYLRNVFVKGINELQVVLHPQKRN